jgi:hypothetical protein
MSTLNTTNLKNPSSGSNNIVLAADGSTTIPTLSATDITGTTIQGTIKSGTAVASTSGTSVDFTGIPSWAKRITVMFSGVSTNGTSDILVRLGTSIGVVTTGYVSTSTGVNQANLTGGGNSTAGFLIRFDSAAFILSGHMLITNISSNAWISSHTLKRATDQMCFGGGDVSLAAALTQIRVTTVNGTDTFDAGSVNILFEG